MTAGPAAPGLKPPGSVTIHPVTEADAADVLRFEVDNRAYFDSILGPRSPNFYSLETLKPILAGNVRAREEGSGYSYLIRDTADQLVGRLNLYGVELGELQVAEVGYRIAEREQGKGYATAALALLLHEAFGPLGLHRVEAHTTPDNLGSQLVLTKNGFMAEGRCRGYIRVKGVWQDFLQFAKLSTDRP